MLDVAGRSIISDETKNWESCHFLSSNIFRKDERDWKMVYLARAEDTDTATIQWKFDFTKEKLVIDSVSIKFETKTYENGVVDLKILNEQGKWIVDFLRSLDPIFSLFRPFSRECNPNDERIERYNNVFYYCNNEWR